MQNGGDTEWTIIAGSAYDVLALTLATGLSVYKPRLRGSDPVQGLTPSHASRRSRGQSELRQR
jgi:hypothetical protein